MANANVSTVRVTNNIHYCEEIMMTMKHNLRNLVLVAVAALFSATAFTANGAFGQGRPGAAIPCPIPMHITLTAPPPNATPNSSDFPPPPGSLANWNGTQANQHFRHTFTWKPETECCQYIKGTLTFKYKALRAGQSATTPDAGNDGVAIYKNGSAVLSQGVYTNFPFSAGYTGTKTISLTAAMLTNNRLSFAVQDDTAVLSATLDVVACCVRP